jgi:hypothetical protein
MKQRDDPAHSAVSRLQVMQSAAPPAGQRPGLRRRMGRLHDVLDVAFGSTGRARLARAAAVVLLTVAGSVALQAEPAMAGNCTVPPYKVSAQEMVTPWHYFPSYDGYYLTTPEKTCRDINIRLNWTDTGATTYGCVIFLKYGNACNYATVLQPGQWQTIATDVRDYTKFRIVIWHNYSGQTEWVNFDMDF